MLDLIDIEPTGQRPDLFADPKAAFAVISVKPDMGTQYREKPVMPLLPRGYCLDAGGQAWTVLRGHVRTEVLEGSDGELYCWYEYEAVNGKRVLG